MPEAGCENSIGWTALMFACHKLNFEACLLLFEPEIGLSRGYENELITVCKYSPKTLEEKENQTHLVNLFI